jgi:hypothetical protein
MTYVHTPSKPHFLQYGGSVKTTGWKRVSCIICGAMHAVPCTRTTTTTTTTTTGAISVEPPRVSVRVCWTLDRSEWWNGPSAVIVWLPDWRGLYGRPDDWTVLYVVSSEPWRKGKGKGHAHREGEGEEGREPVSLCCLSSSHRRELSALDRPLNYPHGPRDRLRRYSDRAANELHSLPRLPSLSSLSSLPFRVARFDG